MLDTLFYIRHETNVWLEITTLLIPGENDSDTEIDELSGWVASELGTEIPLHFTAFHPDYRLLNKPPTAPETLHRARTIAQRNGLRYVYTGNIRDPTGATTYCPNCTAPVIVREGYRITQWALRAGRCEQCRTLIPGVFEHRP